MKHSLLSNDESAKHIVDDTIVPALCVGGFCVADNFTNIFEAHTSSAFDPEQLNHLSVDKLQQLKCFSLGSHYYNKYLRMIGKRDLPRLKLIPAAVTFPWLFAENPDFGIFPAYHR